jgi:hypothetical protein
LGGVGGVRTGGGGAGFFFVLGRRGAAAALADVAQLGGSRAALSGATGGSSRMLRKRPGRGELPTVTPQDSQF